MNNKLQQERKERFLRNLIKEAIINVLAEQDELSSVPPATTPPSPQTNISEPTPPSPSPTEEELPETTPGEVEFTVDSMVDQLNILRGGKSFKDPEVYGKLNTFFNNLTEEQKNSTKWILEELTKIVTNVDALAPTPEAPMGQPPAPQGKTPAAPPAPSPAPAPAAPAKPAAPPAPIKPSL